MAFQDFRPASDVVARRLGDSAVLIRLTTNRIYELNETGARVWELLQTGSSVETIVEMLGREFEEPSDVIRADIDALLLRLTGEGLIVGQ